MIELNRDIFYDTKTEKKTMNLKEWVMKNKMLTLYAKTLDAHQILTSQKMLHEILMSVKDEQIEL